MSSIGNSRLSARSRYFYLFRRVSHSGRGSASRRMDNCHRCRLALGDAIPSRRVFSPSRSNRANSDGSAQFAYYSFANDRGDSPSGYLRRILVLNREQLIYQRTTSSFFVISSIRQYNIFYSRCNFSRLVKCFYVSVTAETKLGRDGRQDELFVALASTVAPRAGRLTGGRLDHSS